MTDPRVPLKNPLLAVCLGLLFPGGGQLYQGRTFKGVLYAICIVGTFTYGMFLSDWAALYAGSPLSTTNRRWGYLAQVPIGTPAMYAYVQHRRYHSPDNVPRMVLDKPLAAPFHGRVMLENRATVEYYEVDGQIELQPAESFIGPVVQGRFTGTRMELDSSLRPIPETSEPVEFLLSSEVGRFELDREIYADRERALKIPIVEGSPQQRPERIGMLRGTIPRPVEDWLAVPLESEKLSRLHFELGKTFDLAMVYTWIAALLNVLVLWDAFEGPAYGYGDETPEGDSDPSQTGDKDAHADKPAAKTEPELAKSPAAS